MKVWIRVMTVCYDQLLLFMADLQIVDPSMATVVKHALVLKFSGSIRPTFSL